MNKTHKKVLGLLGLVLVAIMTIVAVVLPNPNAKAATSTQMTDTIRVRVVGAVPNVAVTGLDNNKTIFTPDQNFTIAYENVGTVTISLKYTDAEGNVQELVLDTIDADFNAGETTIDLSEIDYGYGDYVISVRGDGLDGVYDEDFISFHYYPFSVEVDWDDDKGGYDVNLDYVLDDETTGEEGEVAKIVIDVYDENGNLVEELSPIEVTPPTKEIFIPFDEYGLPSGKYTIEVTAYDSAGDVLFRPYTMVVEYEAIPVPNTGGLFQNLNISKTDYLVTGLIIFGIVGVGGLVFINKRSKRGSRRR